MTEVRSNPPGRGLPPQGGGQMRSGRFAGAFFSPPGLTNQGACAELTMHSILPLNTFATLHAEGIGQLQKGGLCAPGPQETLSSVAGGGSAVPVLAQSVAGASNRRTPCVRRSHHTKAPRHIRSLEAP
jgi:hypothetical protein